MNTLRIQVACGGIEPQFLQQKLHPFITQVACKKKKTPKTTQHPKSRSLRKYQKLDASLLLCNLFSNACIVCHV
jgi:hypothetical protein